MSARLAADRRDLPPSVLVALTVSTGVTVGIATHLVPGAAESPVPSGPAGFVAGSLAVIALRSVSVRWVATAMCFVGSLLAVRFGMLPVATGPEAALSVAWVLSAATTMVIAASASPRPVRRWRHRTLARTGLAVGSIAAAAALALGVPVAVATGTAATDGARPAFGAGTLGSPLVPSTELDMTNRPRLSDALVLTVRTERPGLWRVQTFDEWDGVTWRRDDRTPRPVGTDGALVAGDDDLGASVGERRVDRFRVEAPVAGALPFGPSAVRVETSRSLLQLRDGTLIPTRPLGRGATYSVESRSPALDVATLRAAGTRPVPTEIAERWAGEPTATRRTAELAAELTDGIDNSYDKVVAIERWLGSNTRYSLDAPLSPSGVDVVDHFLFTSRLGWCEQVASSLTVLLRLSGVPARLATGYVPDARDPVTGAYRVLESGAHAWTEVWFADVGWVPFDPTANVPLGRYTPPSSSVATLLVGVGTWVLLGVGVLAALGSLLRAWVTSAIRWLRRGGRGRGGRDERRGGGSRWAVAAERRLEAVGRDVGRRRAVDETAAAYGAAVAALVGDGRWAEVGAAVDRDRFDAEPLSTEERRRVDELVGSRSP